VVVLLKQHLTNDMIFGKVIIKKIKIAAYFLRAIAECFARLSHGLGVCPPVRPFVRHTAVLYQNGASYNHEVLTVRCPKTLVYHDEISCLWVRGFPSNEGVKEGYPSKNVILTLLALLVWKRLQIGKHMLSIITSTGHGFLVISTPITLNDFEPPKLRVFVNFLWFFLAARHFKSELRRNS